MMGEILSGLKTLLDASGIFDSVTIGEIRSERPESMKDFVSIDEDTDSELLETLGLFRERRFRVKIRVRAYRANPYEASAILDAIALCERTETAVASEPTLGGLVQNVKLESVASSAESGKTPSKPSYRERTLTYVLSAFEQAETVM